MRVDCTKSVGMGMPSLAGSWGHAAADLACLQETAAGHFWIAYWRHSCLWEVLLPCTDLRSAAGLPED